MGMQEIILDTGLQVNHFEPVAGGDINQAYCLHGNGSRYFLKTNSAGAYPLMFEKEMAGLQELSLLSTLRIPAVMKSGKVGTTQYLLLEWIEQSSPQKDFWQQFGAALANLHQQPQAHFGWKSNNYIGSLVQHNEAQSSWKLFYTACRIMPLVKQLYDGGLFTKQDLALAELYCKRLDDFFPEETPSLLHGDLWSGNYMVAESGRAAIFDPAVYYGHREMDIGMTKLFGGFSQPFYDAYNDVYPLEKNWQHRLHFTQLYPLLVHAILFGGHYIISVKDIIQKMG